MSAPFSSQREAALALLTDHPEQLNRRCGQFLGQLAADATPLSEKQLRWLNQLLDRVGLPPLADGGRNG